MYTTLVPGSRRIPKYGTDPSDNRTRALPNLVYAYIIKTNDMIYHYTILHDMDVVVFSQNNNRDRDLIIRKAKLYSLRLQDNEGHMRAVRTSKVPHGVLHYALHLHDPPSP